MVDFTEKIKNTVKWKSIMKTIEEGKGYYAGGGSSSIKLQEMFSKCFFNTVETTIEYGEDLTTFVITGDIPAMWLRDSSAQVRHYLPFVKELPELKAVLKGVIKKQIFYINIDPYANAFNKEPNGNGHSEDATERNAWVWERKYEVDSLCYPVQLAYLYWKETQDREIFDLSFREALVQIINLWSIEQRHHERSTYRFERFNCPDSDTLKNHGMSTPVNYTGMTWSGFRPSDDACTYGYLIPSNMFAVVVLEYMEEIFQIIYMENDIVARISALKKEIKAGISSYGRVRHREFGEIYAYEADGFGGYNLMDDANIPSLLSLPYLGCVSPGDPVYKNTRRFILSKLNPYYYEGEFARGVGSPHTREGYIWHLALIMQGLTSDNEKEIRDILKMLISTDNNSNYMHESFNPNGPGEFSRSWFAWANSLFAEFVIHLYEKNQNKCKEFPGD